MKNEIIYSLENICSVADEIINRMDRFSIFAFSGELGAGKTTLIKEVLKKSGVLKCVTSPTFNYVNDYKSDKGKTFFHFDLYRLNSAQEFVEAGFQEHIDSGAIVFIEWPEVIHNLLKVSVCWIDIGHVTIDKRKIKIKDNKIG